jgi:hypothetical protein
MMNARQSYEDLLKNVDTLNNGVDARIREQASKVSAATTGTLDQVT